MLTANRVAGGLGGRRVRGLRGTGLALIAMVCLAAAVTPAWGTSIYTLEDGNSVTHVSVGNQGPGMASWVVNGVNQLSQQWFWYRVGNGPEQSLDRLNLVFARASDTNENAGYDVLELKFGTGQDTATSSYLVTVRYSLMGGQAGERNVSDLGEQIMIENRNAGSLDFHFFQYSNFDLGSTPADDWVSIAGQGHNTATQRDSELHVMTETVVSPAPSHFEAALAGVTLAKLQDGVAGDLSDTAFAGPGDVTWAYQWDFTLGNGQSFIISKDKNMMELPEPVTMAGLFLGLAGVGGYIRKRRKA